MTYLQRHRFARRLSSLAAVACFVAACQGSPSSIFTPNDTASEQRARDLSVEALTKTHPELLRDVGAVVAHRVFIDCQGRAYTRLSQTAGGVPVFGGEAIVHLNPDGTFGSFTDSLLRGLQVNPTPTLSATRATELAVAAHGGWSAVTGTPSADLQVLNRGDKSTRLTYRVSIRQFEDGVDPAMPVVFVDAHTGAIAWQYDNLAHTALADDDDGDGENDRETWDMDGSTAYSSATLGDSLDTVANDAHGHIESALSYFKTAHNRDSFDNASSLVLQYVHYGQNYNNAFWDGQRLTFGDGDGTQFGPFATLDIVTHELSHGVTTYTADLIYSNESGALNEATSDIFAAAAEAQQGGSYTDIWWIGEGTWTPGTAGDALRYMDDPTAAGDYDYYPTRYTGTGDNGGVHWNSGIANLFFHLLSVGGQHPRAGAPNIPTHTVAGIGIQNAADLWYRTLSAHMTTSTNFDAATTATTAAAEALGHPEWIPSIRAAWEAVGLFFMDTVVDTHGSLKGRRNTTWRYSYDNTGGTYKAMRFATSGGTGDADVYVKVGSPPSTSDYDCRSITPSTVEACQVPAGADTVHVLVHAYSRISGVDYVAEGALAQPACSPTVTCASAGAQCGDIADDCGNTLACGPCSGTYVCTTNQCVSCTPLTCAEVGAACGSVADGCGGALDCGGCGGTFDTCGGGGTANQCGCTPDSCADLGANCGSVGDGCGTTLDCGSCSGSDSCGGGGSANVCGCTRTTTCDGITCGDVTDNCGDVMSCGCDAGDICSTDNVCVVDPGPDCSTSGSFDVGCSCTDNNQCTTNKCKGKPTDKTCK